MPRHRPPAWINTLLALSLVSSPLLANQAPISMGDPAITGQPRPAADSPITVTSETLTITFQDPDPQDQNPQDIPVHVRAQYHLKNPTAAQVPLALAFPVFNAPPFQPGEKPWFTATQDGKPLTVKSQLPDPHVPEIPENDEALQRAWIKRLDDWVKDRPILLAALNDLSINYLLDEVPPQQKLRDIFKRHSFSPRLADLLTQCVESPLSERFDRVCALLPFIDDHFSLVGENGKPLLDKEGNPISLLGNDANPFIAHQDEWTKIATTWIASIPDLQQTITDLRSAQSRAKLRDQRQAFAAQLLQTQYHLSPEISADIAQLYSSHTIGQPLSTTKIHVPSALDTKIEEEFTEINNPLHAAAVSALWPDVAAQLAVIPPRPPHLPPSPCKQIHRMVAKSSKLPNRSEIPSAT